MKQTARLYHTSKLITYYHPQHTPLRVFRVIMRDRINNRERSYVSTSLLNDHYRRPTVCRRNDEDYHYRHATLIFAWKSRGIFQRLRRRYRCCRHHHHWRRRRHRRHVDVTTRRYPKYIRCDVNAYLRRNMNANTAASNRATPESTDNM